ncbi:signal transducer and transcription activator 6 isoform X2 [Latimeria chalumnae]|uniref:signal transducer and transcription activator 6 isoform X2 n=1 Tax=Latimeria chalumnae TaxID=7897 RepID=UPI00313F3580
MKMALWSAVQKLKTEHHEDLKRMYRLPLPVELRHYLASWIEEQPWEFINPSDTFSEALARSLLSNLVSQIRNLAAHFSAKPEIYSNFLHYAKEIEMAYQSEPFKLIHFYKSVLQNEKAIVTNKLHSLPVAIQHKQEDVECQVKLKLLGQKTTQVQAVQKALLEKYENLKQNRQQYGQLLNPGPSGFSLGSSLDMPGNGSLLETNFGPLQLEISNKKEQWTLAVKELVNDLEAVQCLLLRKIQSWKRQQQLAGNGAQFDESCTSLQEGCEMLVEVNFLINSMVLQACGGDLAMEPFGCLREKLRSLLGTLVQSTFLVEKQPPQVLKTQAKFQTSVRFLLGCKLLNTSQQPPTVKAMVITETQARSLSQPNHVVNESSGDIMNNVSQLENNVTSKTCTATFKNASLKKIKRSDRKGSESVTEEKCAILFSTEITVMANNTSYRLQVMSLPIVVIVHGSQDNNATATVLWDNAFSEIDRIPFVVPERVSWHQMCETLNMKFMMEVQTQRGLIKEHFIFLAQKMFADNSLNIEDFQNRHVSWAQFNKEPLPGRGFTFWQWFDGVLDLTKKYLKSYWSEGLIIGFISKQYVSNLLTSKCDGTFLLRFSDSEIGGITIAYITKGTEKGIINNIQPFTTKDLHIRSLGDRIRDLCQLHYLYPAQPKDAAFHKYYTREQRGKDGYINSRIKTTVDDESQSSVTQLSDTFSSMPSPGAPPLSVLPGVFPHPPQPIFPVVEAPIVAPSNIFQNPMEPNQFMDIIQNDPIGQSSIMMMMEDIPMPTEQEVVALLQNPGMNLGMGEQEFQ